MAPFLKNGGGTACVTLLLSTLNRSMFSPGKNEMSQASHVQLRE